jgi:hypothetical protein
MRGYAGTHYYGDFCSGLVRVVPPSGLLCRATARLDLGSRVREGLTSFGRDAEGEVYIVDLGGNVYRIVP